MSSSETNYSVCWKSYPRLVLVIGFTIGIQERVIMFTSIWGELFHSNEDDYHPSMLLEGTENVAL